MPTNSQWNIVIKTPMGDNKATLDFQVEGDALTGAMKSPAETNDIYDGAAAGNQLSWKAKVSKPMPMALEFTATVDGDNITGGAKSPFGTAPFSGTRAAS